MSHDYQLAHTTPAPADFWTQGGSAVLAPPTPPSPGQSVSAPTKLSPMTKVHRLLRGRYPLAITLAAAGAITGCVTGYLAVAPRYVATGMVQLDPRVITPTALDDKWNQAFAVFQTNQAGLITSANVAEAAMSDKAFVDAYHLAYPGEPLPDDPTFTSNINVNQTRGASLMTVAYSDRSKQVSETAATAVLKKYQEMYGSDDAIRNVTEKLDFNRDRLAKIESDLAAKRRDLDAVSKQFGSPEAVANREAHVAARELDDESTLKVFQQQYQDAQATATHGSGGPGDNEMVYQEIKGKGDLDMRLFLEARYAAQRQMDDVVAQGQLPGSPVYKQAALALDQAKQRVDDYAHTYVAVNPGVIASTLVGSGNVLTSLSMMKTRLDQMQANVDAERADATRLAAAKLQMADLSTDIANLAAEQVNVKQVIEQMHDSTLFTKTVQISMPGEANLQNDRRKAMAGVGFLFGGFLPLGLMMLYGMRDNRFRYSDETAEADLAGVALLGILPNLPDRLSDPQQAGIAAHCVHQIRTMLQISRANDEPQVLAITSASTGDGKTSLTLALGLSYAACGARTLLIDCDLLAAGLTHRLNVSSPDGVLEAVANRALLEYVRTTDIADVAILPVGTTHAHHASTLSPVALRRLLSEAKKQFDIVIVDTGPILASIEASLICAAADRTILAVARNQQRNLVERSIGHLHAIGASLAGVVFNRAQAKDFEKSMSGLALRSRPNPNNPAAGANAANGTQVAKAVAGSFKRAG
jgi:capsular exopolysaccharide synthesis family protein